MDHAALAKREKKTGHSIYSPSQLARILECPASVRESTYAPIKASSPYAVRGTLLHEIVTTYHKRGRKYALSANLDAGLTIDEINWLDECIDYLNDKLSPGEEGVLGLEASVTLDSWGAPEVWGTSDVISIDTNKRLAKIADWKFGQGVQVYAENNPQMLAYAAGALGAHNPYVDVVELHLCQPPLDHWDVWEVAYSDLGEWVSDVLIPGIAAAQAPDAPFGPSEKACRFCPSAVTCRARLEDSVKAASKVFAVHAKMAQVQKSELAKIEAEAGKFERYLKDIRAFIAEELMRGRDFPGRKLVLGRSSGRAWINEEDAEAFLSMHSSIKEEDMYTKKFITAPMAEKLDKQLKKNAAFSMLYKKTEGKPQVVDESDPRPAITPTRSAEEVFKGVE